MPQGKKGKQATMKKIISLFKRDYEGTRLIYDEVVEGAEWVVNGEGVAAIKYDGTSCLVKDGRLYKRYDAKDGKQPPADFTPAQPAPDHVTRHWPGWVPVGDGPDDKWHRQAWGREQWNHLNLEIEERLPRTLPDGTYELVGPKSQGNPYKLAEHHLWPHGVPFARISAPEPPRDFNTQSRVSCGTTPTDAPRRSRRKTLAFPGLARRTTMLNATLDNPLALTLQTIEATIAAHNATINEQRQRIQANERAMGALEARADALLPHLEALDRERLGIIVRAVWVEWAHEQPNPKPSWLQPWEALDEPDKEVDRRIGEALYLQGYLAGARATARTLKEQGDGQ
jgi:hypothetical protein